METLNRITVAFLEFAEAMEKNRRPMHMAGWIAKLDDFLELGDHPLLVGAGEVQAKAAEQKVNTEYEAWHARAINAPSAVERHFVEAVGKAKMIDSARPKPVKGRKEGPKFRRRLPIPRPKIGSESC